MKTQQSNALQSFFHITFIAIFLAATGCQNKQESVSGRDSSAVRTSVKVPEVDIHTAVVTGNMEAVKQHLAAGTNINEKDPFGGSSPLISAALFDKIEIAKVLIDGGADINFQNNDGSTALITAAFFCRPEIVKLLLDKGADKTIKNKFGATAYDTVVTPFADVKNTYDMMGKMLEPMGLKLDYAYIEKTRPEIAALLK